MDEHSAQNKPFGVVERVRVDTEGLDLFRTMVSEMLAECSTPYSMAAAIESTLGVEALGATLSDLLGIQPVLAVVRSAEDGAEYFKRLDPLTGLESHVGREIGRGEVLERLAQFTGDERLTIDHNIKHLWRRRRLEGDVRGWEYVRLATLFDFDDGGLFAGVAPTAGSRTEG